MRIQYAETSFLGEIITNNDRRKHYLSLVRHPHKERSQKQGIARDSLHEIDATYSETVDLGPETMDLGPGEVDLGPGAKENPVLLL